MDSMKNSSDELTSTSDASVASTNRYAIAVPVLLTIVGIIVVSSLWYKVQRVERDIRGVALTERVTHSVESRLGGIFHSISLLADNWQRFRGSPKYSWTDEADRCVGTFAELTAVQILERSALTRLLGSSDELVRSQFNAKDADEIAQTARSAVSDQSLRISGPVTLTDGALGIAVVHPVSSNAVVKGAIVSQLRLDTLVSSAVGREEIAAITRVSAGDRPLFVGSNLIDPTESVRTPGSIVLPGGTLSVEALPSVRISTMDWMKLAVGILAVALVSFASNQFIVSRARACALESLTETLIATKSETRRAKEKLDAAVRGTNDGLWELPLGEKEEGWWSPQFYWMLGYEDREIKATLENLIAVIHPEDIVIFKLKFRNALLLGRRLVHQMRILGGSREYKWVRIRGQVAQSQDSRFPRLTGSLEEYGEVMMAQTRLAASERELRQILDAIPSHVVFKDSDDRILNVNQSAADAVGLRREQIIGRSADMIFPQIEESQSSIEGGRMLSEGEPILAVSGSYRHSDGSIHKVRLDRLPIVSANGQFDRSITVVTDVTELLEAKSELSQSKHQLRAILDNAPAVIYATLPDGRLLFVNNRFRRLFNVGSADIVGETPRSLLGPNFDDAFFPCVNESTDAADFEIGLQINQKNLHFLLTRFPLLDTEDKAYAHATIATDITELTKVQRELRDKNAELENFVYSASHDLKSPIVTILGYASHLSRDLKAGRLDELDHFVDRIRRAADRMRSNIDALLELSRIGRDAGKPRIVQLPELVEELIEQESGAAARRDIEFRVSLEAQTVFADLAHVSHVLQNLIANAIKYGATAEAPIVEIGSVRTKHDVVHLFVRDNGDGIAPQYHSRIFRLFQRASSEKKGTGIGLAIVARIARLYDGQAWVESEPGRGATFWISMVPPKHLEQDTTTERKRSDEDRKCSPRPLSPC